MLAGHSGLHLKMYISDIDDCVEERYRRFEWGAVKELFQVSGNEPEAIPG